MYLLIWVLLTTQCGRCDDISEPNQAISISDTQEDSEQIRSARQAPLHVHGTHTALLTHHGHGLTGINHGFGGLVTSHQGLGGHPGPVMHYGHDLGNMCGKGFYNGLLGGHHRVLPLHAARQVSGGSEFNPQFKFVINEHSERNPISGPALYRLPTDQKLGMPLFHSNGFYEPDLMHSVKGINGHPTATQWHYPDEGDHAMGLEGTHGVGLGVYYGVDTPQQHSSEFSGSHAGLPSALHKMNNVQGTVGLGSYSAAVGPNGFHSISVKEGKTGGLPGRGISGYYGGMVGHQVMVPPVMEIHKDVPAAHGILPSGHENALAGYQAGVTEGYQGLGNMHNFGLHTDMHTGGTGKYGESGYHGNKYHSGGYYAMNGYHQGEHDGGYNGNGYPWGGYHGMNGYHAGGYHGGGYNGNKYQLMGHHTVNGYHGMNGYLGSGGHRSTTAKRHGSFEFGGSLQQPTLLQTDSQLGDKLKADQHIMSSLFNGETYLKQEKHDETPYFGEDSSNINYNAEDNHKESTSFLDGMKNKSSDTEEVSGNYTKSKTKININIRNGNNILYKTGIPMAAQPSVLSDNEWSDTPYARGLHVDLLHGQTATVEEESDVQAAEEIGLTEGQSGILGKHITRIGSGDHGNPKVLQPQQNPQELGYLLSTINDKLAGRLGFQEHPSNYNVDGKTWTGYDSCKYDNSALVYRYKSVPFIYRPWCCSYSQDNTTPYYSLYRLWL